MTMNDPRKTSLEDAIAVSMIDQLARRAYHAYGEVTEFKNFMGDPMPEFSDLPVKIRQAWYAVVVQLGQDFEDAP